MHIKSLSALAILVLVVATRPSNLTLALPLTNREESMPVHRPRPTRANPSGLGSTARVLEVSEPARQGPKSALLKRLRNGDRLAFDRGGDDVTLE